jgi:GT2 family glycosyltransferase
MPKAVRDIELTNLPDVITDLDGYDGAFLLLRYRGKPVGKMVLPARDGQIIPAAYHQEIKKATEKELRSAITDYFLFGEEEQTSITNIRATVAICTRNRTNDVKDCLDALMKLPDRGQEILVVDNAPSTDDTRNLVAQYPSVRYVLEKRKGLDIARNRAIKEASHDIIAFTDDDAFVDKGWLDAILRNFKDPRVMCVTGMTMPFELETKAQEAIEEYSPFGKGFAKKRFSFTRNHPLVVGNIGAGANMAIRKTLIHETGWFDEALDAGTPTYSGGDHEFFARILLAGYHIIYEPEALNWHRHRRTWAEAVHAIQGYGVGVYAFWTRLLFVQREYGILRFPRIWLLQTQLPNLYKSVFKFKKHYPLSFLLAEFRGCLKGPFAYFKSRNQISQNLKKQAG